MRRFSTRLLAAPFALAAGAFLALGPAATPAQAGGYKHGLAACPHGYSCVPAHAVRRGTIGNPDGRAYLTTDPNYLAFPQGRVHVAPRIHRKRRHVRRGAGYIHTRRYGRVSLHGRTKFCSDHVEWHGRRGIRNCVWVLNSLLDSRGYGLERRGYKRH